MFKESLDFVKTIFENYFSNQLYFIIFLVGLVVLIIEEKKKTNRNFLIYYSSFIIVMTLNPIFCYFILRIVPWNVYYRFWWLLPLGIVMAYFGTTLIFKMQSKLKQFCVLILISGVIIYSGHYIYGDETFEKVENLYKLPDNYIEIINIISELPIENKKAMVPTDMIGYVRQLDASIKLPYQRRPYADYEMYPIVQYYNSYDILNLMELCNEQEVNIIIYDKLITNEDTFESYGFELFTQTEFYNIFVKKSALQSPIYVDEETIKIDGIKNNYKIAVLNDLHLIQNYDDIQETSKETVSHRYNELFKTSIGESANLLWTRLTKKINEINSNLVVLAGDMIDYNSVSNSEALSNGIKNIDKEVMYIRADHDYGIWHDEQLTLENSELLQENIIKNSNIYEKDLGEILIVGINNNTSQISSDTLKNLKEIFEKGKPIILITHVPFNSHIDRGLEESSKRDFEQRNLTWDYDGTYYKADDNTKQFLDMIYAEDSPVKAVIAGHLHFKYTCKLTENITQYIFDATYKGNIGVINITGK